MLSEVLDAIQSALAHILQPLAGVALAKLSPAQIALAQVLVQRFIPDGNLQHLIISLLTNPTPAAHAGAIDALDDHSRAIAQIGTVMLPPGRAVPVVPDKQLASAPAVAQNTVAPVPARDSGSF